MTREALGLWEQMVRGEKVLVFKHIDDTDIWPDNPPINHLLTNEQAQCQLFNKVPRNETSSNKDYVHFLKQLD